MIPAIFIILFISSTIIIPPSTADTQHRSDGVQKRLDMLDALRRIGKLPQPQIKQEETHWVGVAKGLFKDLYGSDEATIAEMKNFMRRSVEVQTRNDDENTKPYRWTKLTGINLIYWLSVDPSWCGFQPDWYWKAYAQLVIDLRNLDINDRDKAIIRYFDTTPQEFIKQTMDKPPPLEQFEQPHMFKPLEEEEEETDDDGKGSSEAVDPTDIALPDDDEEGLAETLEEEPFEGEKFPADPDEADIDKERNRKAANQRPPESDNLPPKEKEEEEELTPDQKGRNHAADVPLPEDDDKFPPNPQDEPQSELESEGTGSSEVSGEDELDKILEDGEQKKSDDPESVRLPEDSDEAEPSASTQGGSGEEGGGSSEKEPFEGEPVDDSPSGDGKFPPPGTASDGEPEEKSVRFGPANAADMDGMEPIHPKRWRDPNFLDKEPEPEPEKWDPNVLDKTKSGRGIVPKPMPERELTEFERKAAEKERRRQRQGYNQYI